MFWFENSVEIKETSNWEDLMRFGSSNSMELEHIHIKLSALKTMQW
jgi:hypothetical protein